MPSAPPATSWPIELLRPSQRLGASIAQRTSHDERSARSLRDFDFSSGTALLITIVREPFGDESAALLRIRARGRCGGRVFDHPPLSTRPDATRTGNDGRTDAIDQGE